MTRGLFRAGGRTRHLPIALHSHTRQIDEVVDEPVSDKPLTSEGDKSTFSEECHDEYQVDLPTSCSHEPRGSELYKLRSKTVLPTHHVDTSVGQLTGNQIEEPHNKFSSIEPATDESVADPAADIEAGRVNPPSSPPFPKLLALRGRWGVPLSKLLMLRGGSRSPMMPQDYREAGLGGLIVNRGRWYANVVRSEERL